MLKGNKSRINNKMLPYYLLLPLLLTLGIVLLYPLIRGIFTSFQYNVLLRPDKGTPFVGLQNYFEVLSDKVFWISLQNTFWWVFGSVFFQFIGGFAIALVLNQKFKFRGLVRGIIMIPWVVPGVIAAMIWSWMLDGSYGLVNDILFRLGWIDQYIPWLAQASTALPSVIAANVWKGFPFFAVMILAGLQSIPKELYDSAKVDGASIYQTFRFVTVPMMRHIIMIATVLRIIWTTNSLAMIFVMTQGGPGYETRVLGLHSFLASWKSLNFGHGATIATIFLVLLMLLTIVYMKLLGGDEV